MNKKLKLASTLFCMLGILVVVMNFNSCDSYSEDPAFQSDNNLECEEASCNEGSLADLTVTLSPVAALTNFTVDFQISGTCSDGGFPGNEVQWRIVFNGLEVQNSAQAGGGAYIGTCDNGAYTMLAKTPCPTGAFFNNGNGNCSGISAPMTLEVRILGVDSAGEFYANPDTNTGIASGLLQRAF